MRVIWLLILMQITCSLHAQIDTVVLKDYAKVLITTDQNGHIQPVTNLAEVNRAGFFLNEVPEGTIRVCNENELFIWVEGGLISSIIDCTTIEPISLFKFSESDTIFVSFSSSKFEGFKCELISYERFKVFKEEVSRPREARRALHEFNIILIIIILAIFGIYAASFPNRLKFFVSKTFSLKSSSYQFINTSFFASSNLFLMLIISTTVAFEIIYVNSKVNFGIYEEPSDMIGYLGLCLKITLWIIGFYLSKRVLILIMSSLFKMRKLKDWQLFDLLNFSGYFILILFCITLWDFIFKSSGESWIHTYFFYYFIIVLILFELWFIIKFVINSSYQKLLIFSYLCATEIIPTILVVGWFFK